MMFDVIDETIVALDIEQSYKAITDVYDGRSDWWMPSLSSRILSGNSINEVGAVCKVTIHNILPISFVTQTVEAIPGKLLRVSYVKGAFVGEGLWEFEKINEGTKIRFHWLTKPALLIIKIMALVYPIEKAHSSVMRKGFEGISKLVVS